MRSEELPKLRERLMELADYYQSKEPSPGAMRVWLDALQECRLDDVLWVLKDWPKSKPKPPLAAEILTIVRTKLSDRLESEAVQRALDGRKQAIAPERMKGDPKSPAYLKFKEDMKALKAQPKPGPKDWAFRYVARCESGEIPAQLDMLIAAKQIVAEFSREPGQEG